jgi:glycosyltransferase involved in cell wall biosynthesis
VTAGRASGGTDGPFVSVVVPTYDRPVSLGRCLAALADSVYPTDRFEVVVVDDGGSTSLAPVLDELCGRLAITLVEQRNAGPAAARNAGAARARGDLLAFTDDDCLPASDWLSLLVDAHRTTPDRLIGGRTVNDLPSNPYAATSQLVIDLVYEQCNPQPGHATFFTANNMAVPAALFRELGGFDASFRAAEDRELCHRWLSQRRRMTYVAEAVVRHTHDLTFASFCRQHFAYGRGAHAYHRRRPPGAMRYSLGFHGDPRKWLLQPFRRPLEHPARVCMLLLVWELANAAGFCANALRSPRG